MRPSGNVHATMKILFLELFFTEIFLSLVNFQVYGALSRGLSSPVNGKHMRVLPRYEQIGFQTTIRNASGFIQEISGFLPDALALLAERNNFTYSYLHDIVRHTDDSPAWGRGLISYLLSGEADLILVAGAMTYARLKITDYSLPCVILENLLLIPSPSIEMNAVAIAKPYQYKVWVLILIAIPVVIVSLYWISHNRINSLFASSSAQIPEHFNSLESAVDYTLGVFCSQGAYYRYSFKIGFKLRILAGCWCLACFVLVSAYNSVLISYILAPSTVPIVDSILDLPKKPDIRMTTEKGGTMEVLFMLAKDGVYKYIGDMIRAHPYLSCKTTDQCVNYVRSRKNHVYSSPITDLYGFINKDLEESGECHLTIAKTPISYPKLSLILAKNSPFTEPINTQLQLFWESGLLKKWQNMYFPKKPRRCLEKDKLAQNPRISLSNLLGAFALFLTGCSLSCSVFIVDKAVHLIKKLFSRRILVQL